MSTDEELDKARALRGGGQTGQYVVATRELADRDPTHVRAQLEAAYACDSVGEEEAAVGYYERARGLGVPDGELAVFTVGYGSTLRNVGRTEESVAVLGEGLTRFPDYAPIKAFLALALHSSKFHNAAMATLLELVLELNHDDQLHGFERALAHYQTDLTTASLEVA